MESDKTAKKPRIIGKPFAKGNNANPHGRPKKAHCFADIARSMLESKEITLSLTLPNGTVTKTDLKSTKTIWHSVVIGLLREAMKGDVAAVKELLDRVEGRTVNTVANVSDKPFVVIMGDEAK